MVHIVSQEETRAIEDIACLPFLLSRIRPADLSQTNPTYPSSVTSVMFSGKPGKVVHSEQALAFQKESIA